MGKNNRNHQKNQRKKKDERAFLFDFEMSKCLAEVDRDEWEFAIEMSGGNVCAAATMAGIKNIPRNARALWGKSQAHALDSYRQWLNRKSKQK